MSQAMYTIVHYTEYRKSTGKKCEMCGVSYTAEAFYSILDLTSAVY
jgi:hypothetical protein